MEQEAARRFIVFTGTLQVIAKTLTISPPLLTVHFLLAFSKGSIVAKESKTKGTRRADEERPGTLQRGE